MLRRFFPLIIFISPMISFHHLCSMWLLPDCHESSCRGILLLACPAGVPPAHWPAKLQFSKRTTRRPRLPSKMWFVAMFSIVEEQKMSKAPENEMLNPIHFDRSLHISSSGEWVLCRATQSLPSMVSSDVTRG